ncbi:response regulator transcription factor [Haloarcula salinisoli]|uniref:Response regulator n=1 Tax=Haloarcula salinisoli TaxID=2487746 RepID=A0A8J7YAW0_9EURY|nr:response regulator [Halomicroarcula salinisoli]MBX0302670.1 response regulator [Halomicroarcula salinisoli]
MTGTAGTVLVIDDDSDLRSLYRCWLAESFEVRTAADGVAGLGRLDEDIDVVLIDRQMPRKDGVSVAEDLDRRELDPAVVMISSVEPDVDLLDISVDDYLQKPVERTAVLDSVKRALAVAEQPRPRRHLVSLDRRRQIVEATASPETLNGETAYQQTVDTLDSHSDTLDAAWRAVPVPVQRNGRNHSEPTPESSIRNSP